MKKIPKEENQGQDKQALVKEIPVQLSIALKMLEENLLTQNIISKTQFQHLIAHFFQKLLQAKAYMKRLKERLHKLLNHYIKGQSTQIQFQV